MNSLNIETETTLSVVIGAISALLAFYSLWIFVRYSHKWQRKTYQTNSISMRHVRRNDFLLSLIATYEPKVKQLLDPPPDKVIVAVSHPPEKGNPMGMVITKVGGKSRKVMLPLFSTSPVRPLFEAILEIPLDFGPESEPSIEEKEASVA